MDSCRRRDGKSRPMADEEHTGTCILQCGRDPLPDLAPVCGPCRSRERTRLREIAEWYTELAAEAEPDATRDDGRLVERADHLIDVDGHLAAIVRSRVEYPWQVSAGAVPGQSNAPRVGGSREAPVPISVDSTDLLADARVLNLARRYDPDRREYVVPFPEDQIGNLPAATILDGWCRDFAETRRESTPEPNVTTQCRYLTDRLDWAFTDHPAVDEFAAEIGDLWHALRRATGRTEPRPELCEEVPCKACDLKALYRYPGSEYVECDCGQLYTEDEYRTWVALVSAQAKRHAA